MAIFVITEHYFCRLLTKVCPGAAACNAVAGIQDRDRGRDWQPRPRDGNEDQHNGTVAVGGTVVGLTTKADRSSLSTYPLGDTDLLGLLGQTQGKILQLGFNPATRCVEMLVEGVGLPTLDYQEPTLAFLDDAPGFELESALAAFQAPEPPVHHKPGLILGGRN